MIVSKPKVSTLFSIGLFVSICLGISGYTWYYIQSSASSKWYLFAIIIALAPIALGLLAKVILGYKVVKLGKGQFQISHPTRFSHVSYNIKQIYFWKEQSVKTSSGTFQELIIQFDNKKKLSLSLQENTQYLDIVKYLKAKCAKKQKHD